MECLKDFGICGRRCPEYKCEVLHEYERTKNITSLEYANIIGMKMTSAKRAFLDALDKSDEKAQEIMQSYLSKKEQSQLQKFLNEYAIYRKGFEYGLSKAVRLREECNG